MNAGRMIVLVLAVAGCCCEEGVSQIVSGSVSDALNASPIGGVTIVLGTQSSASGVTGPDGRYSLPGLKRGSNVTLTYDKWGYGKYSVVVHISGSQVVQDVSLFRETIDAAYWSSWSQKRLAASDKKQRGIVADAWREVQRGGLSREAKSIAARSLLATAPSKSEAPDSMLAAAGATRFEEQFQRPRVQEAQEKPENEDKENQDRVSQTEAQQREATRARLAAQLNQVLQTRDSSRGLIVSMADVLFDTGKYSLKPGAREKLAKIAEILRAYPGLKIEVDGYTDSVGEDDMNRKLAENRAGSVRDYLVQQGVERDSVTSRGFGNSTPVASNDNSAGRQQNRRVELLVSGGAVDNQ
jgi:outer membrane protein OmpA-like peptidoglycan-associated protein